MWEAPEVPRNEGSEQETSRPAVPGSAAYVGETRARSHRATGPLALSRCPSGFGYSVASWTIRISLSKRETVMFGWWASTSWRNASAKPACERVWRAAVAAMFRARAD